MLLQIWFPQIVMLVGGLGAIFCFLMAFSPEMKHEEENHHADQHGH